MSDEGAWRNVTSGLVSFGRLLSLWFAFGLATTGVGLVVERALIGEPFGMGRQVGSILAALAAFVVDSRYPTVQTRTVWKFGLTVFVAFLGLGTATNVLDNPTSGSLYHVATVTLVWVAAVAFGYAGVAPTE